MKNRLTQMLEGRRVAIVGNAQEDRDRSAEIDAADVVVRFNDFYNMATGRVGRRVDIVLQTIARPWFDRWRAGRLAASLDAVRTQRPAVFLVKRPDNYTTDAHKLYGRGVRIDNLARAFEPWWRYTTGTAALCFLADSLVNAEVRCYGFAADCDEAWRKYVSTDAKQYASTADDERVAMLGAIERLERLAITEPRSGAFAMPRCVVVPIKAHSEGAPGKNRTLLAPCLSKLRDLDVKVYVTGDDAELMHSVRDCAEAVPLPAIGAYDDVTKTLRRWQVETGFCGDVALVQCTSPRMQASWVERCFSALEEAPVAATCVELGFKPTAVFREENGVFVPMTEKLPPATVARQLLPRAVRFTGAVTAFHTDALAFNSLFEAGVLEPVMIGGEDALDVDTAEQLKQTLGGM